MASRVLFQRTSGSRVSRISPRLSIPLTLCPSSSLSTRIKINNGMFNNISSNSSSNINIIKTQRLFSTSSKANKELATMSEEELSGLRVQEDRLMRDLHETCEWGKGEVWGR
jgi:hypothetical protein